MADMMQPRRTIDGTPKYAGRNGGNINAPDFLPLGVLIAGCCWASLPTFAEQIIPLWKDESNVPRPSRYESFENGVPEHWKLQGQGALTLNPWHYKLGKQSLQWDYKADDVIRIQNTLGNTRWRGGFNNICFATFGVWVYNKHEKPGESVRFEFREAEEEEGAHFDFPLNFRGWQCAFLRYDQTTQAFGADNRKSFNRPVTGNIDNILIHAPADGSGQILLDCLVYNGPTYTFINFMPRPEPFRPPIFDEREVPVPDQALSRDTEAITRVRNALASPVILDDEKNENRQMYEHALERIRYLEIVEDEHGIRGRPITMPRWHSTARGMIELFTHNGVPENHVEWFNRAVLNGAFGAISRAIASGVTQNQYEDLIAHSAIIWQYALDQGFNTSAGSGHHYAGTYRSLIVSAYLAREALARRGVLEDVRDYVQYSAYPFFAPVAPIISMDYFAFCDTLLYGAFLDGEDPRRQLQLLAFMGQRFSREVIGDFGNHGFKPDGSGYHGGYAFTYMIGGLNGIARVAYLLSDSRFALTDEAYETLKLAALRMAFFSSNLDVPLFMQGTGVFRATANRLPIILRHLALAGKDGCDRELAQAYVNLKPVIEERPIAYDPRFETDHGLEPKSSAEGNISMPYARLVAQRRAGWVAVAHGGGVDMRDRGNHYGYAMNNAPLTVMGKDGLAASGIVKDGWDWNRIDGATAPYIPELTSIGYIHSGRKMPPEKAPGYQQAAQWLAGFNTSAIHEGDTLTLSVGNAGISWRGMNGCFSKMFANDRLFNGYRGIKSYFFIGDRIYALGSDITSYSQDYRMQTTLFQKALPERETPTHINGERMAEFPLQDTVLDARQTNVLIDPVGNGYFVPGGQQLYTARKTQEGRLSAHQEQEDTVGDVATAWIDHGPACQDARYVYVIMPYCDAERLKNFSETDYQIRQQDDRAHVIYDRMDDMHAGIFFRGGVVETLPAVREIERACQIMYKQKDGALDIAVGDPATHQNRADGRRSVLLPLKVTFAGAWGLDNPVAGVRIVRSDRTETVIEFAAIHGKTFDVTLIEKP